jgi:hypothetical protein
VLIRIAAQKRIKQGEVTLAFRRWRKPSVKAGGNLNTSVGLLAIHTVDLITEDEISDHEAKQAGYAKRDDLIEDLAGREGELYRIGLCLNPSESQVSSEYC